MEASMSSCIGKKKLCDMASVLSYWYSYVDTFEISFISLLFMQFEYDDWFPESYRDEWDDDHLVAEANEDFKKHL